jgi:hypothetical protein
VADIRKTNEEIEAMLLQEKERAASTFPIEGINFLLYHNLSNRFGTGDEEKQSDLNRLILERQLNPDDPLVGFQGKIRFESSFGFTHFMLFENIYFNDPILEITGGSLRGGIWTATNGDLMVSKLKAKFQIIHGLDLQSPATILIGRIIEAAGELAKNPMCECDVFWTAK